MLALSILKEIQSILLTSFLQVYANFMFTYYIHKKLSALDFGRPKIVQDVKLKQV